MSVAWPCRWSAPDLHAGDGMLCFWSHVPHCSLADRSMDRGDAPLARPNQFLRMIENRFVTTEESFVDLDWWDACCTGRPIVADKSLPVWAAVDASVKRD